MKLIVKVYLVSEVLEGREIKWHPIELILLKTSGDDKLTTLDFQ